MAQFKHIAGLGLFLVLLLAAYLAWTSFLDLRRVEFLQSWRAELTTWRVPLLALGTFSVLSGLQWLGARLGSSKE